MAVSLSGFPTNISDTATSFSLSYTNTTSTGSFRSLEARVSLNNVIVATVTINATSSSGTFTIPVSANINTYYSAVQGGTYSGGVFSAVPISYQIILYNTESGSIIDNQSYTARTTDFTVNYRIGSISRISPTTANPINLDLASPGNIQYTWSNTRTSYFKFRMIIEVWNGTSWVTTFTSSSFTNSGGTNFTVESITNFINSLTNAMNNGSPRDMRFNLTNQFLRASGTWVSVGSTTVQTVSNGIIKQFQTFPSPNIGSSTYTFPNSGWTTSYFYLRALSTLKSTGLYDVDIEVYLYAGAAMNSTINSKSCTINGATASVKSGFTSPVVLASSNTMLLGTFTVTNIGPFTTRSPVFTTDVTLNLAQPGTRTTGTLTSAVGIMPIIPALESNNIVAHTITNGAINNVLTRNTQDSVGGISENDFSFYKIRIAESTNGSSFSNSRDSAFGDSSYSTSWTSRGAYTLYYYRLEILGRDNSSYGNSIIQLRANDNPPTLSSFTVGTKTTTSIIVNASASSVSAISYTYSRKLSSSGTWVEIATTSNNSYSHTGLTANTLYDFKVKVTNADTLFVESGTAGQPANLTSISTFANAPVISSFTRSARTDNSISVSTIATVDSGLTATYSYGIRQGASAFVYGTYSASATNVFSGLTPGASYDMRVRVQDSLGNITESSTLTSLTFFPAPVISSVNILNLSTTNATVKISVQTNQSTSVASYRFKLYPQGDTEPVAWISRTVDNYSVFGLSPNQAYVVKSQVVDNQGLESLVTTTNFTTLSIAPITSNIRARLIRTLSTTLPAVRDGNLIVATDTGDVFMDTNSGRRIISYGLKAYEATVTGSNISFTTTNFNNVDYGTSGAALTFYIIPDLSVNSATATITIIRPGDTNLEDVVLERTDSETVVMTAGKPYLISFANNKFYIVNDR
jgi:hypothetical protein